MNTINALLCFTLAVSLVAADFGLPCATTNGEVSYSYDAVGNRVSRTSTVPNVTASTSAYDANDRLASDTYDAAGNTVNANGNAYSYDFENRLS